MICFVMSDRETLSGAETTSDWLTVYYQFHTQRSSLYSRSEQQTGHAIVRYFRTLSEMPTFGIFLLRLQASVIPLINPFLHSPEGQLCSSSGVCLR
jgi:hypothetical protein